jgi:hypothetical protein
MKIYISKYRDHWVSPYTMLDYAFFWTDWSKCARDKSISSSLDDERKYVERPAWTDAWSERLMPISRAIQWLGERIYPRIEYVKIDRWDTWSMDHTLGMIALPMLKQLKASKQGSPFVDDEDVPEELKSTSAPPKENEWDTDDNHFKRWDWALDEMIFAFENRLDDSWQDAFRSGEHDITWIPVDRDGNEVPKGEHKYYQMGKGPNDTYKCDYEGMKVVEARIQNGFRLFGKYYQALWD